MDAGAKLARSHNTRTKVAAVFQKRMQIANEAFSKRINQASVDEGADLIANVAAAMACFMRTSYTSASLSPAR